VRRAALTLLVLFAAVSLRAQSGPSVRPGTNAIRVDVYASLDGKAVDDLQANDLELLEDGVPQTIDAFEHVQVGAPGSSRARVFVIFLDTYNTQIEASSSMRLPLIKILDRVIGPDDMVAVMTPEMSPSEMKFGRKPTVISNIMQSDWAWTRGGRAERRDQKETLYDNCYAAAGSNGNTPGNEMKARRREKLTLDVLDGLVADLGGVRDERKAVLTISDGWVLFRENESLAAAQKPDQGGLVDRLLRRPSKEKDKDKDKEKENDKAKSEPTGGSKEVNYVECEADRVALAALDHSQRLRSLTENANRSNISFYAIDPRGLTADPAGGANGSAAKRDASTNAASRQDSLRFIAENTDGVVIANATNLDAQITRIVDDLSSYYLLTYSSSNTKLDGRFRATTVRVKREGVKVRVRRGYRGRTADDLVSSTGSPGVAGKAFAASTPANARSPFRIRTSTWVRHSPEDTRGGAFWVVGELDYQTRRQLAWTAGAEAEVVVVDARGHEVMTRTVDLKPDEGPFSIQVPESGGIAAGEYAVSVRIRSQADEKAELTSTARVVLRDGSALGEAVISRRGLSTGPRYMRTADPRFTRSDRLKLELATSVPTQATARILDRNHNELSVPAQVSERDDPSGAFRWIVVDAMLAPFAAGNYAIEVTQGREKQITDFQIVP
jgi:VWFA-related protein